MLLNLPGSSVQGQMQCAEGVSVQHAAVPPSCAVGIPDLGYFLNLDLHAYSIMALSYLQQTVRWPFTYVFLFLTVDICSTARRGRGGPGAPRGIRR